MTWCICENNCDEPLGRPISSTISLERGGVVESQIELSEDDTDTVNLLFLLRS